MNRSIWIRPGITENSIQMVSAPGVNFQSVHETLLCTIQMKTIDCYFQVVLFVS